MHEIAYMYTSQLMERNAWKNIFIASQLQLKGLTERKEKERPEPPPKTQTEHQKKAGPWVPSLENWGGSLLWTLHTQCPNLLYIQLKINTNAHRGLTSHRYSQQYIPCPPGLHKKLAFPISCTHVSFAKLTLILALFSKYSILTLELCEQKPHLLCNRCALTD